jgi:two-component system sensor histidine kinase UhpB
MLTDVVVFALHDHRLVVLSVLISILAAYAASDLSERVRGARGRALLIWLVVAATVDGIGTWSMHYTGKLALRLPVPVLFDWRIVLLSLLVSIIGSACALLILSHSTIGLLRTISAGIVLGGVGISGLHYTAMAAMRLPGMDHHYFPAPVIFSVLLAMLFSSLALTLTFLFRRKAPEWLRTHGGAWLRGLANPVMHYTAMAGVIFVYSTAARDLSHTVSISSLGVLGISIVPVMVLVVTLLTSLLDRLQKQRSLLDELFEQAPQAVALLSVDYKVVRVNREFTRLFGYSSQEAIGRQLRELIIPDELRDEDDRFIDLVAQGSRVDSESVRRRKDGSHLHVSIVRVPVSLAGGQIGVYAIYRDFTERKRSEAQLRATSEQLRSLSASLQSAREEEGTRIARELHDELGSALSSLRWDLEDLDEVISETGDQPRIQELRNKIEAMMTLTDTTVNTVRRISSELRPLALDELGLIEAIEWYAAQFQARTGIVVNCECTSDGVDLSQEQSTAVFRIYQEALTNILRHAHATRVEVKTNVEAGEFIMLIVDNGRGITEEEKSGHRTLGLLGMRERAHLIGGKIDITGTDGKGTVVTVRVSISI